MPNEDVVDMPPRRRAIKQGDAAVCSVLPLMPNEALASVKDFIVVDSLNIVDSRFDYREQFTSGGAPGVISFTEVNACAQRIQKERNIENYGDALKIASRERVDLSRQVFGRHEPLQSDGDFRLALRQHLLEMFDDAADR